MQKFSLTARARQQLKSALGASYGHDISGPAATGQQAIQWLSIAIPPERISGRVVRAAFVD